MASAVMVRNEDESVEIPKNYSPASASPTAQHTNNDIASNPNGNGSKAAVVNGQTLPNAPRGPLRVNTQPRPPSLHFVPPSPGAFPFTAAPGSVGPSPTTKELLPSAIPNGIDEATSKAGSGSGSGEGVSRRKPNGAGSTGAGTPPEGRRSVQFARWNLDESTPTQPTPLAKSTTTWEDTDTEQNGQEHTPRDRQASGSFFIKLKSLAHNRTSSSGTAFGSGGGTGYATPNAALSPQSERSEPMYPVPDEAVEDAIDGDQEDSDTETPGLPRQKQRRRRKRPTAGGSESAPTTPRASRFASFVREHMRDNSASGNNDRSAQPQSRQGTLTDVSDTEHETGDRAGVSEDEGRDRVRRAWRRGIEGARALSYAPRRQLDGEGEASEQRRPGNLRRLTGFGAGDGSSPFRHRADRHNSTSAQKWRQVKSMVRTFGQRKKDERAKIDHQKSAQLMAELIAGAPAALIFASMFQRDEHHHKRVPVLLEQLKITIPDVQPRTDKKGDRDYIYKVDLEYGNGPARMNWTIYRSVNDFMNLHLKYKSQNATDKVVHLRGEDKKLAKMPHFPRTVIPYARGLRGLLEKIQDEEDEPEVPDTGGLDSVNEEGAGTPGARPRGHKRRQSSFAPPRRASTSEIGTRPMNPDEMDARQKAIYAERTRKKLEIYLQQMIRWLIFRPDSTRLCKFLEVSAMAIRLAAESGYQGKQGLLQIASRRHREIRRNNIHTLGPHAIKERHKRRWFLVRHSYVVCVDGPESLIPYDVFLVDSDFALDKPKQKVLDQKTAQEMAKVATENATPSKKAHLIQLYNAERKMKLYARNEKQFLQFRESLTQMKDQTVWSQKQRFGSFAPVRNNVWARWLVDGRDHMWQVSRAIDNAKDFVYIHDWWLSPELYMRRPAAISQKWRLDRLLQRKAEEGVKIFVIVYRNIESAIPIDSEYTKWSLLDLHENIIVQRSPNQFRQNQFFWAHHEKLVVVDNMMAFVGGVDLCFGRWDDPCHSLTDDKPTGFELDHDVPRDSEHCQVWPGKDYSNPRVQDFYQLDRPYEEMYDRTKVPRMPWHDIAMQLVGQPARDVGRHFVQRWNYVLRSRVPTRPTPVLIPPPEYDQSELEDLGMTGTCQVQILRSSAPWSIGYRNKVEHSIMNAYCSLIQNSDHFVYIENQFYVSSTVVEGTTIHNKIGDAIVERAIRAHENGEQWQACLVIPLMPGFQNSVDAPDGTSVRLIMMCQFRSICRGEYSIFGRLRAAGINPEDFVRFYSLRQWGKIGPRKCLTTEQLYIHAKCMVVDDRSVIIGSANINERSMLGSRDSEVAAVVTDTCMLPGRMAGRPYQVGEFPHTLRKRLMREHLGLDVDAIYRREQAATEREDQDAEMERIYRHDEPTQAHDDFAKPPQTPRPEALKTLNLEATAPGFAGRKEENGSGWAGTTQASSDTLSQTHIDGADDKMKGPKRDLDVDGYGFDNMKRLVDAGDNGYRDTFVGTHGREILSKKDAPDAGRIKSIEDEQLELQRSQSKELKESLPIRPPWPTERTETALLGLTQRSQLPQLPNLDDTDIGGPPLQRDESQSSGKAAGNLMASLRRPHVSEDCMTDPLATEFYRDIWHQVAENNTKLYRQVFRCMPDSEVLDWAGYQKFNEYNERFMQSQGLGNSKPERAAGAPRQSGPPGTGGTRLEAMNSAESKSMISGFMDKLRPGSKNSSRTHTDESNEKARRRGVPASPKSTSSSAPTAVPSPDPRPLDEKEASQPADHLRVDAGVGLEEKSTPDTTGSGERAASSNGYLDEKAALQNDENDVTRQRTVTYSDGINHASETTATQSEKSGGVPLGHSASQKRRRRGTTKSSARPVPDDMLGRDEAEELLNSVQGHLVLWPYDWLEKEERGSNWLYNIDQLAPLEIYD
ncbi:hypothetical protein AC579_1388 [Pseudocercospora musae]|uniref:Phospholipase D1 n=1 Tax=Pseudocercospora musae TaxID=113226 RepID=A0A139IFR5_9PEZI|nr:hypothetical protein AC579_1388 [Pseudocercospora musae]